MPYKASDPSVSSLLALPPNGSENWTLMARTLSGALAVHVELLTRVLLQHTMVKKLIFARYRRHPSDQVSTITQTAICGSWDIGLGSS